MTETIPARYDWFQTTAVIHLRCDEDLAPDPGYADSWHTHLYGGVDGMLSDLPDDPDAENYADHAHDYTPFDAWYTNPDKPIMKPVVETRHVKGYIEYWRHEFDPELMVYVFGLGPYNKSIYEDQKDENWLDDQYQFLVDYIQRSLTNRTWAMTEDIVAADLIGSALNTILEMSEISFKEACIECMSFLEDNYNL